MIPKDRNINIAEQTRLSPGLRWHESRFCLSQFLKSLQDWVRCCESFWHFLIERKICTAKTLLNGSMAWFFQNIRDAWLLLEMNKMHKTAAAAEMRLESLRFNNAIQNAGFFLRYRRQLQQKSIMFGNHQKWCDDVNLQRCQRSQLRIQSENCPIENWSLTHFIQNRKKIVRIIGKLFSYTPSDKSMENRGFRSFSNTVMSKESHFLQLLRFMRIVPGKLQF